MNSWYIQSKNGYCLNIRVVPKSSRTEIVEIKNEYLKLRVKAAPVENQANIEVISYLSKIFGIPKSDIIIKSGKTGKNKLIEITGITKEKLSLIRPANKKTSKN